MLNLYFPFHFVFWNIGKEEIDNVVVMGWNHDKMLEGERKRKEKSEWWKEERQDRWLDRSSFNTFLLLLLSFWFSPSCSCKSISQHAFRVETFLQEEKEREVKRVSHSKSSVSRALEKNSLADASEMHQMWTRCHIHFHFVLHFICYSCICSRIILKNKTTKNHSLRGFLFGLLFQSDRRENGPRPLGFPSLLEAVNNLVRVTILANEISPWNNCVLLLSRFPERNSELCVFIPRKVSHKVLKMTESDFILNLRKEMTSHPCLYCSKEFRLEPPLYPFSCKQKRRKEIIMFNFNFLNVYDVWWGKKRAQERYCHELRWLIDRISYQNFHLTCFESGKEEEMSSGNRYYRQSYFYNITRCSSTRKNISQVNERHLEFFRRKRRKWVKRWPISSVCSLSVWISWKTVKWSERKRKGEEEEEEEEWWRERGEVESLEIRDGKWYRFQTVIEKIVFQSTLFQFHICIYCLKGKLKTASSAKCHTTFPTYTKIVTFSRAPSCLRKKPSDVYVHLQTISWVAKVTLIFTRDFLQVLGANVPNEISLFKVESDSTVLTSAGKGQKGNESASCILKFIFNLISSEEFSF